MGYRPGVLYPLNWNKLRHAIFKERNYTCEICGRYCKGDLHLHHKRPVQLGGSHNKDNLMVLCRDCHYNLHFNKHKI